MAPFDAAACAFMDRALALAAQGLLTAPPNPRVGCVVVNNGVVIGEGFHVQPGHAHAEVNALADVRARGHDSRGATLYVTLEPCNHHGRTPPCVDAILGAGIVRVVAAMADPNPVASGGIERLRAAGIVVELGPGADAALDLNPGFVSRVTRGRPWVRMKIAASIDGRTALQNAQSQWITGPDARADGHAWRARACAILTGIGTVLHDDPRMTVREVTTPRQPLRVIVDRHGETPASARILEGDGALIVTAGERNRAWPVQVESLALPDEHGRVDLAAMMQALGAREVNELHVEAGAKLNGALLEAGLVDELLVYIAPRVIGDPARGAFERPAALTSLAATEHFEWHDVQRVGADMRMRLRRVMGAAS
ncbi:MAG: bifunctional diaminohydroxyphosphoribosylaminopyrimidine deaminase/5-amino-6-(5-phosphoribosylamino)uracil reductase RibD [Betaproteobacteria bacterium]